MATGDDTTRRRDGGSSPARPSRPVPISPKRAALLGRVKQARTAPEEVVAVQLRALGIAYRRNVRDLPGSPDFANKRRRFAIFVNGCFWHHHRGCRRATIPKNNRDFWTEKFAANRRRDAANIRALRRAGYRVIVIWECAATDARGRLQRLLETRHSVGSARVEPPGER